MVTSAGPTLTPVVHLYRPGVSTRPPIAPGMIIIISNQDAKRNEPEHTTTKLAEIWAYATGCVAIRCLHVRDSGFQGSGGRSGIGCSEKMACDLA